MEVLSGDDITTGNGQNSANSKTELANNHITTRPVKTMVTSMPAKEKSDSSIAQVLVNEYVSNGDKQSKKSYDSEASMAGGV